MELLGEYHRDKVLVLPKNQRKQVDLPTWQDDIKIIHELFGWVLQGHKIRIVCRSENEAQYIYSLWSFEWTDFWVPKNDKYLAEILPRLLVLKKGHDELVEKKTFFYTNRKIREAVKRQIYLGATLRVRDADEEIESTEEEALNEEDE
ncbi:MAG: hypothetical protein HY738_22480 [Bacteroidia bacterium]|nr:hypothetical protein [Bacteroidia bacterium]